MSEKVLTIRRLGSLYFLSHWTNWRV